MTTRENSRHRLERATDVFLREVVGAGRDPRDVLAEHEDLRELLEPMVFGDPDAEAADSGDPGSERRVVGEFVLVRELGRGGMGVVWEAEQPSLRRRVAVKLLPPELQADAELLARFEREAVASAKLDHPGIVTVHAAGVDDGTCWLAMDLIEGVPFDVLLRRLVDHGATSAAFVDVLVDELDRRFGEAAPRAAAVAEAWSTPRWLDVVVRIVGQVAEALAHAHANGLLHRDVKPGNVLVRGDGTVVLTDFGIARQVDAPALTRTGRLVGTPFYLAPEQIRGDRGPVDHRADVFALGVMLFEGVALRRPFVGEGTAAVLDAIVSTEPERLDRAATGVPRDLVAITVRALAKDRQRRYATAADFAADLHAFAAGRPVRARVPSIGQRLVAWARREPAAAALAVLLALALPALSAGAAWYAAKRPELDAGRRELARQQLEELLTSGYLELGEGSVERALAHFAAALEAAPTSVEAIAGFVFCVERRDGPAAALSELETRGAPSTAARSLERLRAGLVDRSGFGSAPDDLGRPRDAVEHYVDGVQLLERGHGGDRSAFVRAEALLRRAVLLADRPRALFAFEWAHAVGHVRSVRRVTDCTAMLERHWPDSWQSRYWTSYAWGRLDPRRAAAAIEPVLEQRPDDAHMWTNYGDYLEAAGENAKARDAMLRALELGSDRTPRILSNLVVVLDRLGEPDAAETYYAQAVAESAPSIEHHVVIARIRRKRRDFDGALAALDGVPPSLAADPSVVRSRGQVLLQRGELDRAIGLLERSVASERGAADAVAWFYLGRAYRQRGDEDAAKRAYESCLEVQPTHGEALTNLGHLEWRAGRYDRGIELMSRALEKRPDLVPAWCGVARICLQRNRHEDLAAHLDDWEARGPKHYELWEHRAWNALALVEPKADAPAAAVALARRAEAMAPENPHVLTTLGSMLLEADRDADALEVLTRAKQLGSKQNADAALLRAIDRRLKTARERVGGAGGGRDG